MEEQELAIRCARGDNAARKELYERYGSRILALCRRYVSDPADAEDLKQDAFIKIFRTINRFQWTRPGSLYSWMSRITINLAFDSSGKRRDLARQLVDVDVLENDIPDEPLKEEAASVPPEILAAMIEALPEGYRTVFKLYCIDGLSHKDIASLLGIKEKSSSASLSRARKLLSEAIQEYWCNQEEGASPAGWSSILRKMRREAALRVGTIATAIFLPLSTLLIWQSNHHTPSPIIANQSTVVPNESTELDNEPSHILEDTPGFLGEAKTNPSYPTIHQGPPRLVDLVPNDTSAVVISNIESQWPESSSPSFPTDTVSSFKADSAPGIAPDHTKDSQTVNDNTFLILPEQNQRHRPRLSLNLWAGSGTTRRGSEVRLNSTPYIAALTYMNAVDPAIRPGVRSNSDNAIEWLVQNSAPETFISATNSYRHDIPVSLGLTARTEITKRMGLESGIEYTYLHSDVDSEAGQLDQRLHFVGIPIRMDFRLWTRKSVDLYVGLGAKAEKCISASLGKVSCEEKTLQWSAGAFAGAQYKLGSRSYLYFQPEFSYGFTKTDLITYRTENPFVFSLNAGIRFDL